MINLSTLDVIVGGQFGSEAKGHVTRRVIERLRQHAPNRQIVNVRVAGPNAGHCVMAYPPGRDRVKLALRTIPVGVVDPEVLLYIAPGSEVDIDVLVNEIYDVQEAGLDIKNRLWISDQATVLAPEHIYRETGMQERMGSTGKGIGAARSDRIMRTAELTGQSERLRAVADTYGLRIVNRVQQDLAYDKSSVVIEGTQGYGLGLHAGYYPQCTSSDCRPIDFVGMADLDPSLARVYTPWVVCRVHPIRVAGNSGPLKGETSWEDLHLPEEYTTVTKKVRRVGEWDPDLVKSALRSAGPDAQVALTMFDQIRPVTAGVVRRFKDAFPSGWTREDHRLVSEYGQSIAHPIRLVTTGPDEAVWRW